MVNLDCVCHHHFIAILRAEHLSALVLCDSGEILFPCCKSGPTKRTAIFVVVILQRPLQLSPQNASIVLTFSQLAAV